jgi:Glycine-rich domain-containing protein-like
MENTTFLQKLKHINLEAVINKLMSSKSGHGWSAEKTQVAVNRYRMFLYVSHLYPYLQLVPTEEIDEVWHTHILIDTSNYIQDCQYLFGYILHHRSSFTLMGAVEQQNQNTAFAMTQKLFEQIFGGGTLFDNIQSASCMVLPMDSGLEMSACMVLPSACVTLPNQPQFLELVING